MAQKPQKAVAITAKRVARFYRLLQHLAAGPKARAFVVKRLKIDARSFYRDLEQLRVMGVGIRHEDGKYTLRQTLVEALGKLPCPDPHLSLQEAIVLSKGSSAAHRKLKKFVDQIRGKSGK
jgi:hypothetical protein